MGLGLRLKRFKLSQERMSSGSLFYSSGAETAKAYDLRLKLTGLRRSAEDYRSVLDVE